MLWVGRYNHGDRSLVPRQLSDPFQRIIKAEEGDFSLHSKHSKNKLISIISWNQNSLSSSTNLLDQWRVVWLKKNKGRWLVTSSHHTIKQILLNWTGLSAHMLIVIRLWYFFSGWQPWLKISRLMLTLNKFFWKCSVHVYFSEFPFSWVSLDYCKYITKNMLNFKKCNKLLTS